MRQFLAACFLATVFAFAPMQSAAAEVNKFKYEIQFEINKILSANSKSKFEAKDANKIKAEIEGYLEKLYQKSLIDFYQVAVGAKDSILVADIMYDLISDEEYTHMIVELRDV